MARVAVVTGAAGGIGRALADGLAARGDAVVLGDVDAGRLAATVDALRAAHGARVTGVAGDVATPAGVQALLDAAPGPVDVFCANAGVAAGAGLGEEADWDLALAVNVRAHVVAARLLLPGWLERGGGTFVATASAAGLLTQLGSAPYAVTKHAAVGFAEWLSVTDGDRGVRVLCVCPMGVETRLLSEGIDDVGARQVRAAGAVLAPEAVAGTVLAALDGDAGFLVLPHPEVATYFARKAQDHDRWLGGMRRLQARVT